MEAFWPEIQGQLDRYLDLLEKSQRKRELLALVDLDLGNASVTSSLPCMPSTEKVTVLLATVSRVAACTSVISTR
jgi:hypothetical protein